MVALNDRRVPGSADSIKLIAVAPAGVFVIDAKHYKGLVHTMRPGTIGNLGPARAPCGPTQLHRLGRSTCAVRRRSVRATLEGAPWGSDGPGPPPCSASPGRNGALRRPCRSARSGLGGRRLMAGAGPSAGGAGLTDGAGGVDRDHHRAAGAASRRIAAGTVAAGVSRGRTGSAHRRADRPSPASSTRPPGCGRGGRARPGRSSSFGVGMSAQLPGPGEAGPDTVVPGGPDVEPAQGDRGGTSGPSTGRCLAPGSDGRPPPRRRAGRCGRARCPDRRHLLGQVADGAGLGPAQPQEASSSGGGGQHRLGGDRAAQRRHEAAVDGGGGPPASCW